MSVTQLLSKVLQRNHFRPAELFAIPSFQTSVQCRFPPSPSRRAQEGGQWRHDADARVTQRRKRLDVASPQPHVAQPAGSTGDSGGESRRAGELGGRGRGSRALPPRFPCPLRRVAQSPFPFVSVRRPPRASPPTLSGSCGFSLSVPYRPRQPEADTWRAPAGGNACPLNVAPSACPCRTRTRILCLAAPPYKCNRAQSSSSHRHSEQANKNLLAPVVLILEAFELSKASSSVRSTS